MAFSFNPGQTTSASGTPGTAPSQGAPVPAAPTAPFPGAAPISNPGTKVNAAPTVPDSPFYFISQRNQGKDVSVGAYIQIILVVVAILSVLASIILFTYSMYLTSSIASKKADLAKADATFKEYPIEEMQRLSKRFAALNKILKEYVSARSPLGFLEDVVERQVVFDEYNFAKNRIGSGYVMNFTIITSNYRVLFQQLTSLNLAKYSKIIPKPKTGSLASGASAEKSLIKVQITAPVSAEGMLPEEVESLLLTNTGPSVIQTTGTSTP